MGLRGGVASRLGTFLLREIPWLLGGSLLGALLLFYLHESWQLALALLAGFLGAVLPRRLTGTLLARFPGFLRLNFELGFATVGMLLASWATLVLHPTAYWVFRWRPAVALPVAAALLGLALAAMFRQQIRYERVLTEHRDHADALREETLRAELRALQSQINPHFLFNALGALAELTRSDAEAAETLVQDLAHLLRYSLRAAARPRVTLGQELETVDRYLRIEQARLGDRLRVSRDIGPGVEHLALPGLVLQPLVENAVKHAVSPRPEGGTIRIEARREDEELLLVVADDGPGLPEAQRRLLSGEVAGLPAAGTEGAGGGLANALRRVTLAYRRQGGFDYSDGDGGGARITLRLPALALEEGTQA